MDRSSVRINPARAAALVELPSAFHPLLAEKLAREKARREWTSKETLTDGSWGPFATAIGRRELRVQDAILKVAEARGHAIRHGQEGLFNFWLIIDGQRVDWEFRERYQYRKTPITAAERKLYPPDKNWKSVAEPSGNLVLTIKVNGIAKQDVQERHNRLFEKRIDEILAKFESKAVQTNAQRNSWAERQRARCEREARIERQRLLEEREEDRWCGLQQAAARWKEAELLREFVGRVERRLGRLSNRPTRTDLWLAWARDRIKLLDPFMADDAGLYAALIAKPMRKELSEYEMEFGEPDPFEAKTGERDSGNAPPAALHG
jgi:hypothetical protein